MSRGNPNPNTAGLRAPWPKGQSANPGGRPNFADISEAVRRLLREPPSKRAPLAKTRAERIAFSMIQRAEKKPRELEVLLDRAEGKVPRAHELTGLEGVPLFDPARLAALLARRK